jgi:flavin reductase (DIM6/NTAB) family NADH-FMN oxidoreductase RutF
LNKPFEAIAVEALPDNPFRLIGEEWLLITAGTPARYNTMTASWGGLGVLWNCKVAMVFVRPTRYTYEFMEAQPVFTLSFLDSRWRDALDYCGSHSGREVDKAAQTGLTPVPADCGSVTFAQARLVLECRTLYSDDLKPARFLDPAIETKYPKKDYHRMYVGEILRCWSARPSDLLPPESKR